MIGLSLLLMACDSNPDKERKEILKEFTSSVSKVEITKKWIEFDVTKDGEKGLVFHLDFNVYDLKNQPMTVIIFIEHPKGNVMKDLNGKYCTNDGSVCVTNYIRPGSDKTHFDDLTLFLPYKEVHMKKGEMNYFCNIRFYHRETLMLYDNGREYLSFIGISDRNNLKEINEVNKENVTTVNERNVATANKDKVPTDKKGDKYYSFNTAFGNMEMWVHPDGSSTAVLKQLCHSCNGNKKCNICGGTGNAYAMINGYMRCPACPIAGECATCNGEGYIVRKNSWTQAQAQAYMESHRDIKSQYSQQKDKYASDERRYLETIEYAPNYTGQPNDKWCDKCQRMAPAHSHIKKRIPN